MAFVHLAAGLGDLPGIEGHDSDSTELAVVTSMSLWRYTRCCRFGQAVAQPADACCRVVIEVDVEEATAEVFRGYTGALTEVFDRLSREPVTFTHRRQVDELQGGPTSTSQVYEGASTSGIRMVCFV
jgi:hypothetical protein